MKNPVIIFLLLNGFKQVTATKFENRKCLVWVRDGYYLVVHSDQSEWSSEDTNIYTLIGYLTYYGLMTKRYKTKQETYK